MMADPATGTVAATAALATTAGSYLALGAVMPPGASWQEFVFAMLCAMAGAFCFQFIAGQVARQNAIDAHVAQADLPRVDRVMVAYAVLGAPLSAAFLVVVIHYGKGATGFGDPTFLQSVGGYMAAGAVGPRIVIKGVAAIVALASSKIGGKTP